MRKANAIVTVLILILFLIHLIWGSMELAGIVKGGSTLFTALSHTLLLLVAIHLCIGIRLTADTLRACRISGVSYLKQNRLFWIRRISGFAFMLFLICHLLIFRGSNDGGVYRLKLFDGAALLTQLLMAASLLVHLLCNIAPLRIALGIGDRHRFRTDVLLVFAALLLLGAVSFVIYFIRWSTI